MNECPCEECLVRPRCKNKFYLDTVEQCQTLTNYLYQPNSIPEYSYRRPDFYLRIKILENIIKPATWFVDGLSNILGKGRFK